MQMWCTLGANVRAMMWLLSLVTSSLLMACTQPTSTPTQERTNQTKTEPAIARSERKSSAREETPNKSVEQERWLFIGDSLTAGYGLSPDESYVSVLEARLSAERWLSEAGHPIKLINAGISGDTSAGVLRRVDWLLNGDPVRRVFLCIGANDGLRGQPVDQLKLNLKNIIKRAQAKGAEVTLIGMKIPPNYGARYAQSFERVYPEVAAELKVALLPFLLEGVAGSPKLNLPDGIHPNREGQARVAEHVFSFLRAQSLIQQATPTAQETP